MADAAVLVAREANVVLGLGAFTWLLLRMNANWERYDQGFRRYAMALLLFAFSSAYASLELVLQDVEAGLRSFFLLAANATLLAAMWGTRGRPPADRG